LDEKFDLSNQLKITVVDQTYKPINRNYGGPVDQSNPDCLDVMPTSAQNVNPHLWHFHD